MLALRETRVSHELALVLSNTHLVLQQTFPGFLCTLHFIGDHLVHSWAPRCDLFTPSPPKKGNPKQSHHYLKLNMQAVCSGPHTPTLRSTLSLLLPSCCSYTCHVQHRLLAAYPFSSNTQVFVCQWAAVTLSSSFRYWVRQQEQQHITQPVSILQLKVRCELILTEPAKEPRTVMIPQT